MSGKIKSAPVWIAILLSVEHSLFAGEGRVDLHPHLFKTNNVFAIEFRSGKETVGIAPADSPAGVQVRLPGGEFKPLCFTRKTLRGDMVILGPTELGGISFKLRVKQLNPSLIERSLEVTALTPQKFAARFDFFPAEIQGTYSTFSEIVSKETLYNTLGGGPEYPDVRGQTFPLGAWRTRGQSFGIIGDSPGDWENRCMVEIDPGGKRLSILNGDGRSPYDLQIKYDAKDRYHYQMDGWQSLTAQVQSPFGMRVISKADGSLLPNHNGSYVYGGSWFLCDGANYLLSELHGIPGNEANRNLIWRIEKELAWVPAFNESISTVTGKPHGHILYSWNSGYWFLRKEFRRRSGTHGPDPVDVTIDRKLGVVRDKYGLRLEPKMATLRPSE